MATPNARARHATKSTSGIPARQAEPRDMLNYRLGERIGQEELATLYRATHLALDRPVQIAVLRRSDWVSVSRFQLAMRLGARLSHPNLLPVIDAGHDDHYGDYMVTPQLDARTLQDMLAGGPLDPLLALRVFSQIGAALEYLHSQSIVHRDVQPANIYVTPQGTAYLANFSLASAPDTPDFSGIQEADYRTIYAAPEQDIAQGQATPAQDLYSLGAVAYHMFSGHLPPPPDEEIPPLPVGIPDLSGAERVIRRLMAPDPAARYSGASLAVSAMHQALRALRDDATDDMQESRWEPIAEWLDNPLELVVGDLIDQEFVAKSRARADALHRVDAIRRQLDRWSRHGMLRRPLLGQVIQPEQIVSYNVYTYQLRAHYETRTPPQARQSVYSGAPIDPFSSEVELWQVPVPAYEPFVDAPPEPIVVPGSRKVVPCGECNGAARLPCKTCNGSGVITRNRKVTDADGKTRSEQFEEHCPTCHGYGQRDCPRCSGSGQLLEEKVFTWSRHGRLYLNEDDITGLHRLTIEAKAQPVYEGRIDPHEPRWYQIAPLKELLEDALRGGGEHARLLTAELTIKGVPVTEVDYRYREKPHTLALIGFDNTVRGDTTLFDKERIALYAVIAALAIVLILFVALRGLG